MTISTKLMLAVYVPVLLALVITGVLTVSYRNMTKIQKNGDTVRQIRTGITELNHIIFSYILYHGERPKLQFPAEHDELIHLIVGAQLHDAAQTRLLEKIIVNCLTMKDLFLHLITAHERKDIAGMEIPPGTEDRLTGMLLLQSYEADSNASILRSMVDDGIKITEIRTIGFIFLFIVFASMPLTILLLRTKRGITFSLSNLNKGAAIIGSGNLDYVIPVDGKDEISDLSRDFNRMSAGLKTVTASKAELEKEIERRKETEEELQVSNEQLQENSRNLEMEIYERRNAEEALRESEQRWATTLASIGDAVIATDTQGSVTFMNGVAEALTGWTRAGAMGHPITKVFNIINEETRMAVEDPVTKVLKAGTVVGLANHTILVRKDGTITPIDDSGAPIRDRDGTTMGVVLVFRDITERKEAEEELRKSHDKLEVRVRERTAELVTERKRLYDVFDTLPVYVVLLTPDYHIPFANRFFIDRFGESHGKRCFEYLFGREEPCEICDTYTVLKTNTPHHWEWTGPDSRNYDIYDFPFIDSDGSTLILETGIDITERKRAEKALNERTEQLRAMAHELIQTENRERKRLAEILHDHLQQILVGAKLSAESARRQAGHDDLKNSIRKVVDLLDESIKVSRSLTAELSPPIIHEGGLIPGLRWLARWMEEKQGLRININAGAEIPPDSEGISLLLFQSIRELLLNVVKHADVKEADVSVNTSENNMLQAVIGDKGKGFDTSQIGNYIPDSGFGLFSIRERIDYFGGHMNIVSAPGMGTNVTLTVPLPGPVPVKQKMPYIPVGSFPEEEASPAGSISAFRNSLKIRVLVVDDHTIVREGFVKLIQSEKDMEVAGEASNGEEAIDMARRLCPDVIIMDISMPNMNGIEATEKIISEMPQVRIIGLSMYELADREEAICKAGASAYLTKDGPSKDLIETIRREGLHR